MPTIIGAGDPTSGYEIDNSLRFNDDDSAFLDKTFGSSGNRKTLTISCWIKRATLSTFQTIISACPNGSSTGDDISFQTSDKILIDIITSNGRYQAQSSGVFRDVAAWYHVVVKIDTTQASNRMLLYVNGELQATNSEGIPQNEDITFLSDTLHNIGRRSVNNGSPADYYMSDFHFIDGTALAPTSFAETNENGVWVPIKYTGSYGTNGFHLEFQQTGTSADASGKGADTSGNGNHFDDNNLTATDVTTDTPTNNFATLNPLIPVQQVPTYSEGNTKVVFKDGGNGCSPLSTFVVNSGKWYFEAKFVETSVVGRGAIGVGIVDADKYNPYGDADDAFDLESFGYSYTTDGHAKTNNSTSSFGSTYASGDIISVAVDFDNRQIYYSKNGTLQNSGDPTSGASGTGSAHNFSVGTYYFAVYGYQNENSWEMNFGNAPFSISSSNSDGNGYGSFEYAVPSGYYSLCTKNLAEYG